MSEKWMRKFQLTVEAKDGYQIIIANPFTIQFSIVRHNLSSSSHANIKLYNLGMPERNRIFKNVYTNPEVFQRIELKAGYDGLMPIVFKGSILEARSYRMEGAVDYITEIEAYDGGHDIAYGDSNFSVAPGTSIVAAIRLLCLDMPSVTIGAIGNFPGTYARQRVFSGKTSDLLSQETGGNWFIDNGKIYCLHDNEVISGDILTVSSDTGLLGAPNRTEQFVIADMLFEPRLRIGQGLQLDSKDYPALNQLYKVIGVQHRGTISDAKGGKCISEARMMYGEQNLTIVQGTF